MSVASTAAERLIVALDTSNAEKAMAFVRQTRPLGVTYKIGLELFVAHGPDVVRRVQDTGAQVFLDLKLHDIPNTVYKAAFNAAGLGVRFLSVHALGLRDMLDAAALAVKDARSATELLAITVLTHHDVQAFAPLGLSDTASDLAIRLLKASGAGACVCSAQEAAAIRQCFGPNMTLVVPGIRPNNSQVHDQTRIATPQMAINNGANYLVVGRPITQSDDPFGATELIIQEIGHALQAQQQAQTKATPRASTTPTSDPR